VWAGERSVRLGWRAYRQEERKRQNDDEIESDGRAPEAVGGCAITPRRRRGHEIECVPLTAGKLIREICSCKSWLSRSTSAALTVRHLLGV